MGSQRQVPGVFILFLLLFLTFQVGCAGTGGGSSPTPASSVSTAEISRITEIASASKNIVALQGGSLTYDEATIEFPAAVLPEDAQIKVSKVSVSESDQDASLIDMTNVYVISTISSGKTLELVNSATLKLKINPTGFDETTIRLVVWDGYEWGEVPFAYDDTLKVISSTAEAIMPYGTRIYLMSPDVIYSNDPRIRKGGTQIFSEFVAVKVVGETQGSAVVESASTKRTVSASADTSGVGRAVYVKSPKGKFTVTYNQVKDPTEAADLKKKAGDIGGYMDNAYNQIVTGMGLKEPGVTTEIGYGKTWPVKLRTMSDAYGSADADKWQIYLNIAESSGDGLAHTCHHEFTHLVQFKTLKDAGNSVEDSLDWFGETMADAVGFYAQQGRGIIYSLADTSMGYFYMRLDADKHTLGKENDDYEYRHFPFISYLLAKYTEAQFKKFFETWYSYTPGSTQISMTTIDTAALTDKSLGKALTGRDGIFWDFYRDYFITGEVFNKNKFLNLSKRSSGTSSVPSPFEITDDNKEKQGVTIVEVSPGISYQKEFTIQRLAGQVAILRFKGSSPVDLSVKVSAAPGQSVGHIQLNAFKRVAIVGSVGTVLQATGDVEDVSDSITKTKTYTGVGTDVHDIYLLMTNTTWKADDYKVTVVVTEKQ